MSYPKKSATLRSITIDDTKYRWHFSSGDTQSTLLVYGPESGHQALCVSLLDWRDEWLAFPEPTNNQPKIIGPGFVRQAIEFGLSNGWKPEEKGEPKQMEFKNSIFSVRQ